MDARDHSKIASHRILDPFLDKSWQPIDIKILRSNNTSPKIRASWITNDT
jgi:hypothetical protein